MTHLSYVLCNTQCMLLISETFSLKTVKVTRYLSYICVAWKLILSSGSRYHKNKIKQ